MTEPRFLLDANVCIYLLDGTAPILKQRVESVTIGGVVTSAVAFAEVMMGIRTGSAVDKAERFFTAIKVLPFDQRCGEMYATLPFKRAGFDRLIAAHALAADLILITNNERDFAKIPGLRVENWTR